MFYYCLIWTYVTLILASCGSVLLLQNKRRNGELPIRDQQQTGMVVKNESRNTEAMSRKTSLCARCHDMFTISEREFQLQQSVNTFCIRLLQVKRCIKNLRKDHTYCDGIAILVLNTGVFIKLKNYQCSALNLSVHSIPNIFKKNRKDLTMNSKCKYVSNNTVLNELQYCGMFGDPHLRTFSDQRQTCVVAGAWSLIDNKYFAIQVTNELVQTTQVTSATASNKISIVFREDGSSCISQKVYEATSEFLPRVFADGTLFSGSDFCKTEIQKINEKHVKISSCHSNTTIVIRKTGSYLNFNLQTPFEIANQSSGLCYSGCPSSELVDSAGFLQNNLNEISTSNYHSTTEEAMKTCTNANLTDFYYDSCVFDLLTTGDKLFADAALTAMIDALELEPKLRLKREHSIVFETQMRMFTAKRSASNQSSSGCSRIVVENTRVVVIIATMILNLMVYRR